MPDDDVLTRAKAAHRSGRRTELAVAVGNLIALAETQAKTVEELRTDFNAILKSSALKDRMLAEIRALACNYSKPHVPRYIYSGRILAILNDGK